MIPNGSLFIRIDNNTEKFLDNREIGYITLSMSGTLHIHGFRGITPATKVEISFVEHNHAMVFTPDDNLAEDNYMQFNREYLTSPAFISLLDHYKAINCLFVLIGHRWFQVPGIHVVRVVKLSPET